MMLITQQNPETKNIFPSEFFRCDIPASGVMDMKHDHHLLPDDEERPIATLPAVVKLAQLGWELSTFHRKRASLGIRGQAVQRAQKAVVPAGSGFRGSLGIPPICLVEIVGGSIREGDVIVHASLAMACLARNSASTT